MNNLIAKNIMGFMGRVQLQGVEVPVYHEAMCALYEIANHKESDGGAKAVSVPCSGESSVKIDGVDAKETANGTDD